MAAIEALARGAAQPDCVRTSSSSGWQRRAGPPTRSLRAAQSVQVSGERRALEVRGR
jgi:hypothetical protein